MSATHNISARITYAAAVALVMALIVALPAAAVPKKATATMSACTPDGGSSLLITLTWEGFRANAWSLGVSDDEGGLAAREDIEPAALSGTVTGTIGLPADPVGDQVAAAGVYRIVRGDWSKWLAGPSDEVSMPGGGWTACPA